MRDPIVRFLGTYRFLSNFYPSPMRVFDEVLEQEVTVPSVEHGYQADKTLQPLWRKAMLIGTKDEAGIVVPTAAEVKKLGQQVELRPDWDDVFKVKCMMRWLRLKFQDWDLRKKLLATEDAQIVEGTTWHDRFWGICTCDQHKGEGQNYLGRALMKLRQEILDSEA